MPEYKINLDKHRAKKQWDTYVNNFPDKMEEVKKFLQDNPEDRLKSGGKLKKLKGKLKGVFQLDINDSDRVWYTVDSDTREVFVDYVGAHPTCYK